MDFTARYRWGGELDRPFQGIGWLPQLRNVWLSDEPGENGDVSSANAVRRDSGEIRDFGAGPVRTARREPRSETALTFAVCGLTSSGRFFVELSSTVNVSHSGCCLWLHTCPQADSALALREAPGGASLPKGASQVLFQVAWLRPQAGGWLVGAFALGQADLLASGVASGVADEASGKAARPTRLAFPFRKP
jgi:hypothetical protein